MAHLPLNAERMKQALELLDAAVDENARLIIGGGAAMVLAYQHSLATQDIDAFSARGGLRLAELDQAAKHVAKQLDIEPDWLNSHFETFTAVLPSDYATRLRTVFRGKHIVAEALGPEDLLIMKCFAGRSKDLPHARKLLKVGVDLDVVDRHLSLLMEKRYPNAEKAAEFFDTLRDSEDV